MKNINITNPDKLLWEDIKKIDYVRFMYDIAPYIIKYSKDRFLTSIRYPDGINKEFFYQKNAPSYTPDWINTASHNEKNYINLNSKETLIWLANQAVIEFHTSFNCIYNSSPDCLVFDLDPSYGQKFEDVIEISLIIYGNLKGLNINSFVKTSGSSGIQIYIPTKGKYDYITARKINKFFAKYFFKKYPEKITIERLTNKRGKKLYFDYLQMWEGKTIITPYSPRANKNACISTPVTWDEIKSGIKPNDFTLKNILKRLKEKGDPFDEISNSDNILEIDNLLKHIK